MEDYQINVYEGEEPYAFISYAHADSDRVRPLIRGLQERGVRIWYDGGIDAGLHWGKVIADHLEQSTCVVCFLSPRYVISDNCNQELYYAKKKKKGLALGHLEEFQLPAALDMELVLLNHTFRHHYGSDDAFLDELTRTKLLEQCREVSFCEEQAGKGEKEFADTSGKGEYMGEKEGGASSGISEKETEIPGEEMFQRGNQFLNGSGVARDEKAAIWWYTRAAEQGHIRAQCNLGACYASGRGVEKNPAKSLEWYTRAAEQGDVGAQFHVAYCHDKGRGTKPDPAEAVKWYRRAAEQDHIRAQSIMGQCYNIGRGVEQDPAQALEWYLRAAHQGDMDAQFNAGFSFDKGRGTEPNPEIAVQWYALAAEQNDPRAQFNLGQCFAIGRGVPKNPVVAAQWYIRAADQNHPAAQYALSLCYRDGVGVPKDRAKAARLLKQSKGK